MRKSGDKDGNIIPRTKAPSGVIDKFSSTQASNKLIELLGGKYFSYPKPVDLIKWVISRVSDDSCTVLDFFSGSATTAQAVMELNNEDGGSRRFILVQYPELLKEDSDGYAAGFKTICDVGLYRIKKSIEAIDDKNGCGVNVFKLDSSNIKKWIGVNDNLQQTLMEYENNIKTDESRTDLDIVYEIIIKLGLDLSSNISIINIGQNKIYTVGFGALMIYLNDVDSVGIAEEMIKYHEQQKPEIWKVIFKDNGFKSDDVKANVRETLKMAGLKDDSFITL